MISGDMLYVFLLIRVYVILKFFSVSCYLNNIMSYTDREHWSDYNQIFACHTEVTTAIILITLHFWWQCNPHYCSRIVLLCKPQILTQITAKWIIFLVLKERSCQIWVIFYSSDTAQFLLLPCNIWWQCNSQYMLQSNFFSFFHKFG